MYFSSPVKFLLDADPLLTSKVVANPTEPFFLKKSLNPVMLLPCLAKTGGNCQEAVMLVEEVAFNLKAVGGFDGTEINQNTPDVNFNYLSRKEHVH